MELFRVTSELISMTEIVRILEEQMEVEHRMDCAESMDMSSQGSSKFNNWSQVPKPDLVEDKTVVNSLQKPAILTHNCSETLHNPQRSMGNTTSKMEKRPHRTPEVSHQDNMASGVASLRNKKLKGYAYDKEISFSNASEQLKMIPVIVNGFTAYSNTFEVPTMEEINTK